LDYGGAGHYLIVDGYGSKFLVHQGLSQVRHYSVSGYTNNPSTYIWNITKWDGALNSSGKCVAP
jgi:hypothetical protein